MILHTQALLVASYYDHNSVICRLGFSCSRGNCRGLLHQAKLPLATLYGYNSRKRYLHYLDMRLFLK